MIWTCDNCGRKMEVSRGQLEETGGVVVCPQCLGTGRVAVGDEPPQHRRRAAQPRGGGSGQQRPPARKKSASPRAAGGYMSSLGCAWRSVVIVAAFMLVYQLLGFLMSM